MHDRFNAKTLIVARETRSLTQQELSEKIDVPQSTVSKIENGTQLADDDFLSKVSNALHFPVDFFCQPMEIYPPNLHYRKRADVPVRLLSSIEGVMNIYRVNIEKLLKSCDLPFTRLPILDNRVSRDPKEAARMLRQFWNIPRGPIDNMTKIIEDNGIIVIRMDFGTEKIDGRSMRTSSGKFIIFINKDLSGDRLRLTLAHELAHIILHIYSLDVFELDTESEAMDFAREFLMPANEIKLQLIGSKLTIQKLADLKRYWKTSMQSILYWAEKLKTVTPNQARYLWSQFVSLGIKIREPIEIPQEKPSLLNEVVTYHFAKLGYSKEEVMSILNLYDEDFETWYRDNSSMRIIR